MADYVQSVMNVPCTGRFHITVMKDDHWRISLERDGEIIGEMTNVFFEEDDPRFYGEEDDMPVDIRIESFMWEALFNKINEMKTALDHDANPQHIHVQGSA